MNDGCGLIVRVLPLLSRGALVTLTVAPQAALLALGLSLVVGSLRTAKSRPVLLVTGVYVEFFRGTSAFVQLFWAYFALPMLGVRLDPLTAGIVVLGLNVGAYGSEVVGAPSVPCRRGRSMPAGRWRCRCGSPTRACSCPRRCSARSCRSPTSSSTS